MKNLTDVLFYFSIVLVPLGLFLRIQDYSGGSELAAFGLLVLFIFFLAKTIGDFFAKNTSKQILFMQVLLILMPTIIFSKYFYHGFGDIPGLIIIPLFILFFLFLVIKGKLKGTKLFSTSAVYLVLTIPLFAFHFLKEPRKYIPLDWYNTKRYDISKNVTIKTPYKFKYSETKDLDIVARSLSNYGDYNKAIEAYKKARQLEPENQDIFLDMSDTYARMNNLEDAISLLDTAIITDNTYAPFYNNRGLLYYKLIQNKKAIEDYNTAIQLDPTQPIFYANLALVLYYEHDPEKACDAIKKSEGLGLDLSDQPELKQIKNRVCQ
jgi:tetratricopeptide (TPR) repeat protein